MIRKGYRNCTKKFSIDSNTKQFSFSLSDTFLRVDFFNSVKSELAPIERVNIYLKNGRLLKNIFIINGELAYYYEKEWYYQGFILDEDVPKPIKNIFDRFNFVKEDVLVIRADNNPKPASFNWGHWITIDRLFGVKPNPLDTRKSIEKNIFIKIEKWETLPNSSSDILYSKSKTING